MRFAFIAIVVLSLSAVVAACSDEVDDTGNGAGGSPPPSPEVEAPTPTLEPEATPTPEPTPAPTPSLPPFTAAECQYADELVEQLSDVGEALLSIGELAGRADLFTEEWIWDMAVQFTTVKLSREAALTLDPPTSLANLDAKWASIMDTLDQAVDLMTAGIDEIDAGKIDAATELLSGANAEMVELNPMIEEFGASRSGECP